MKCSPKQLREEYSPYEQRFFWDFLQLTWEHENDEIERANRKNKR